MTVRNARVVMASRREPADSLEFYPTPPWATRALCSLVLPLVERRPLAGLVASDPAAGEGHMIMPLREYFGAVRAADIADYGCGWRRADFLVDQPSAADWIVINPPFRPIVAFVERALLVAERGVAIFCQARFLETVERYPLFAGRLALFAPFAGRVAINRGVWKPDGSTATSYAWFVWTARRAPALWSGYIIPPWARATFHRPDDVARMARITSRGRTAPAPVLTPGRRS